MAKIIFIRTYEVYGHEWADILYNSGRLFTMTADDLPKTARKWMEGKDGIKQYDRVYKRDEVVYR